MASVGSPQTLIPRRSVAKKYRAGFASLVVVTISRLTTAPPTIPDYELLSRIGAGAYGEVWLARNLATGAQRAIKIVHRSTFADERPFHREFEGLKKFDALTRSHPTQLTLFQVAKTETHFYYVMELADRVPDAPDYQPHTLRRDLEKGRLPASDVLALAHSLAESLHHLHTAGLIHRDVKPSNIIFVQGRPKLADIGLVTDATDTQSIVGTEGYLPREGPGSPAADLYALGKVLYEALTGHDRRQFPELPADLRQWPDAPLAFELNTIILKLCADHPSHRYPTAATLLADLQHLARGKSIQLRRSLVRAGSVAWKISAVALLIAGAIAVFKRSNAPPARFNLYTASFKESGTTNVAAWEAYRRAIQIGRTYSPTALSNSAVEFLRATELDPNFVGAWSTLSITLSIAVENGFLPADPALAQAKAYAEQGLRIDPEAGGPLRALAHCELPVERDFKVCEERYRIGIAKNPANWTSRINYSKVLFYLGRLDESEALVREIIRDEPNEAAPLANLGMIHAARGNLAEARASFDAAIRLERERPTFYADRADILWALGERREAAQDWLRFIELGAYVSLNSLADGPALRDSLARQGPEAMLKALIALLEDRARAGNFVSSLDLARLTANEGDREKALSYLEKAVDEHRNLTFQSNNYVAFRDLRNEPRFQAVLRRLKLK